MKITSLAFALISLIGTAMAFAHGEDKPGPHGGYIRMPGAYHTEVVPQGKSKMKVYLLDIEWKNPTVENSSVELVHQSKVTSTAQCKPSTDHFECSFDKNIDLSKKAQLQVKSQRQKQKGNDTSYPLPLKIEKVDDGHDGHH